MQTETGKLSVREKIGYSLGDWADNFIFQTFMLLQLSFYTDTFGLSAAAAGKIIYAYITYFLLLIVYSANNNPDSALNGVITGNMAQRTSLFSYRFVVEPGIFEIMTGSSSRDSDLQMTELNVES